MGVQQSPYFFDAAALERKTLFFGTQNGHLKKQAKHTTDTVLGYKGVQTPELRVHVYDKVVQYYFVRHLCCILYRHSQQRRRWRSYKVKIFGTK